MQMLAITAAATALLCSAAFAEERKPPTTKDIPVMRPTPEGVAKPDIPQKGPITAPAIARAAGCVSKTVWNTGGVDYYSNSFAIKDSAGVEQAFAFAPSVLFAATPGSLPLASRADSEKWRMVIESVERAAAARRYLLVDYETVSRRTFGVYILWDQTCP